MKKILIITAFLLPILSFSQTKINGIVMPNVMKAGEEYLKINGGGVREKLVFKLYIGVLYLQEKSSDAKQIINDDKPMGIKLRVISSMVNRENMEEAIREGFKNSTGDVSSIKSKIDLLIDKGFSEEIKVGDMFDLLYIPKKGLTLSKDNKELVTIEGLDFKKALFGIWLCDKPADSNLKKKMLGQ